AARLLDQLAAQGAAALGQLVALGQRREVAPQLAQLALCAGVVDRVEPLGELLLGQPAGRVVLADLGRGAVALLVGCAEVRPIRHVLAAARIASRTSTTWRPSSPLARCGVPSRTARQRSCRPRPRALWRHSETSSSGSSSLPRRTTTGPSNVFGSPPT